MWAVECYSFVPSILLSHFGLLAPVPILSCSPFPGPLTHCFYSELDQLQGQGKLVYQMAGQAHWAGSIRLYHLESV